MGSVGRGKQWEGRGRSSACNERCLGRGRSVGSAGGICTCKVEEKAEQRWRSILAGRGHTYPSTRFALHQNAPKGVAEWCGGSGWGEVGGRGRGRGGRGHRRAAEESYSLYTATYATVSRGFLHVRPYGTAAQFCLGNLKFDEMNTTCTCSWLDRMLRRYM
jgi:hypothetical protein